MGLTSLAWAVTSELHVFTSHRPVIRAKIGPSLNQHVKSVPLVSFSREQNKIAFPSPTRQRVKVNARSCFRSVVAPLQKLSRGEGSPISSGGCRQERRKAYC